MIFNLHFHVVLKYDQSVNTSLIPFSLLENKAKLFLKHSIDLFFPIPFVKKKSNKPNKVYDVSFKKHLPSLLAITGWIQFITGMANSPIWKDTKNWKLVFALDTRKACRRTLFQQDYLHVAVWNMGEMRKYTFNLFWKQSKTSLKKKTQPHIVIVSVYVTSPQIT